MSNPYSQVISELQKNQTWRGIVFAIARFAPSAVLRAIDEINRKVEEPWVKECREMMRRKELVPAVKKWREMTGAGLKEAKDAVESL